MSNHLVFFVRHGISAEDQKKYVTLMFYKMQLEHLLSLDLITYDDVVSRMDDKADELGITEEEFMSFFSDSRTLECN